MRILSLGDIDKGPTPYPFNRIENMNFHINLQSNNRKYIYKYQAILIRYRY